MLVPFIHPHVRVEPNDQTSVPSVRTNCPCICNFQDRQNLTICRINYTISLNSVDSGLEAKEQEKPKLQATCSAKHVHQHQVKKCPRSSLTIVIFWQMYYYAWLNTAASDACTQVAAEIADLKHDNNLHVVCRGKKWSNYGRNRMVVLSVTTSGPLTEHEPWQLSRAKIDSIPNLISYRSRQNVDCWKNIYRSRCLNSKLVSRVPDW